MGNDKSPGMVSKLSGSTKQVASSLMSDPRKIENMIGMVRTFAPLTSPQTVSKINTYLPLAEKTSTLLGMYSFLNRAQTFKPLEPLNAKTTAEKMSALMKSGSLPLGKLAQPLLAGNMEKMMEGVAMNMLKNGNLGDMLKNGNLSDMLNNKNISDMLSSVTKQADQSKDSSESTMDLSSLMETFMPILSSMSQQKSVQKNHEEIHEEPQKKENRQHSLQFKNESSLPDEDQIYGEIHEAAESTAQEPDISLHEEIEDKNQRQLQRPVRIRHRPRKTASN
ncbi:MAG: hypothetical protein AAGU76_05065 [Sedimentibacter sp.]|uniref:hypothetical protein n=1 Tax=Sedimentibacter sp. TaxID=1960295 RepID=UPI0031590A46